MIDSRKIADLDPIVAERCKQHLADCAVMGIDVIVTSTWRDYDAQDALYAVGRGPVDLRRRVTNAKGGESWHNFRVAYDVVPLIGGKCVWNDPLLWEKIIEAAESLGIEAGAHWKTFPDQPHFQFKPSGLSIAAAKILFEQQGTLFGG